MCALGHPEHQTGRFVLLQILLSLCIKPQHDYLVLDRSQLGVPAKIYQKTMKPFFIAPEYMFSEAQHEQLTQRRELELRRLGLIYDPNKIKPRDTHNPHGLEVRNKIIVEDEADVKNQRNRDLFFRVSTT